MKLVIKREPFEKALSAASAIVPVRHVRPILKYVLLTSNADGNIELQATDLEVGLRHKLVAESVKDPQSLCLPCAIMAGLLRECTEEVITLETDGAKGVLKVGRDRFDILGQESSDFPEIPELGEGASFTIPGRELASMIDRTLFSAAREQGRFAINGVYFLYKEKTLEMVATDGRRLAYCKKKLKSAGNLEEGVIVPVKMMVELRKLCEQVGEDGELNLAVRGRSILAKGGDITLSSLLVEGIFPKFQQVIPKDCDKEASVKRDALSGALRKAIYLTSDETRTVTLGFSAGTLQIESRSPDKGQASVTIEAEYGGEKLAISFNPQYIQDCLKVLNTDTIKIEMKDPSRPGVIREGADYLYVLMPVSPKD